MPAAHSAAPEHPLDTFFSPSSIAIIGASRDALKIPGLLLAFLRKNQFPGEIFPVNPNYPEIDGLTCYPQVSEIKAPIDLAIVIIPARAVLAALGQCADAGSECDHHLLASPRRAATASACRTPSPRWPKVRHAD